jgi:FKBP-type peptidyl-prolyl cis-trans isomerase SlyD
MKINLWALILSTAVAEILFSSTDAISQKPKEENVVKNGSVVSLEYTLSDEKGKPLESNRGKEPLTYTHGQKQIIPGLEKEIAGMKVGGEKHVQVKPEEAYGPVNPKAFQEVPREKIPPDGLKVGATLMAKSPQGQSQPVRVAEIKEKTVVLDLNHPLAGKTLTFDLKVLDIQPPQSTPPQPAPQSK